MPGQEESLLDVDCCLLLLPAVPAVLLFVLLLV
jgi:hypothetical protein